jgi:hypothetical protein
MMFRIMQQIQHVNSYHFCLYISSLSSDFTIKLRALQTYSVPGIFVNVVNVEFVTGLLTRQRTTNT